jgi:hypothetical protein
LRNVKGKEGEGGDKSINYLIVRKSFQKMAYLRVGKMKAMPANALQSCEIRGRGPSVTAAMKRFGWGSEAACITAWNKGKSRVLDLK